MGRIRLGNKPPLTIGPEVMIVQAARAMTERNVGAATVIVGTEAVGVVTERDVMRKVIAQMNLREITIATCEPFDTALPPSIVVQKVF